MPSDLKQYQKMCRQWSKLHGGRDPDPLVRYGLPYDVDDPEIIVAALEEKRRLWQTGRRQQKDLFLRFLKDHEELRQQLLDAGQRQRIADEARALAEADEQRNGEKIEAHLARLNDAQRPLGELEFKNIARIFADLGLAEEELRQRLTVEVVPDGVEALEPREQISQTVMEEIDQALKMFQMESLYDFLEVPAEASAEELEKRYRDSQEQWSLKPRDDENSTAQKILGMIATYLLADEGKRRGTYDEALETFRLRELLDVDLSLFAASQTVTYDEYHQLMQTATAAGFDPATAKAYIKRRVQQLGAQVETSQDSEGRTCPQCNSLNLRDARHCTRCQTRLLRQCPACQEHVPTLLPVCDQCGTPLDLEPEERGRIESLHGLLESGNLRQAEETLQGLQQRHPQLEILRELEEKITQAREKREQESAQLQALIEKGNVEQARTLLQEFLANASGANGLADFEEQIRRKEEEIQRELRDVLRLEKGELPLEAGQRRKGDRLMEAERRRTELLNRWPDNPEVRKAYELAELAPPVGGLEAWCLGPDVELSWEAVNGLTRVRRSILVGPRSGAQDFLPDVEADRLRDTDLVPGEVVQYELWRRVDDRLSEGAIESEPVVIWQAFEEAEAVATDSGEITLSWGGAGGAEEVEIVRSAGEETTALRAQESPWVDQGLEIGRTYEYLLRALYRDHEGELSPRNSVTVQALATTPPPPPGAVKLSYSKLGQPKGGKIARLEAAVPSRGVLRFYRLPSEPPWPPGHRVTEEELAAFGPPLAPTAEQDETCVAAIDQKPAWGVSYYMPVIEEGAFRVLGTAQMGIHLNPVRNLRKVQGRDKELHLRWDWPEGASHACLFSRIDAEPESREDPNARCTEIELARYQMLDGHELKPSLGAEMMHFAVVGGVKAQVAGESRIYYPRKKAVKSARLSIDFSNPTLTYEIDINRGYSVHSRTTSAVLTIEVEPPSRRVPALVLLADTQRKPLATEVDEEDMQVLKIAAGVSKDGRIERPIDSKFLDRERKFALYFQNSADHKIWKIQKQIR